MYTTMSFSSKWLVLPLDINAKSRVYMDGWSEVSGRRWFQSKWRLIPNHCQIIKLYEFKGKFQFISLSMKSFYVEIKT